MKLNPNATATIIIGGLSLTHRNKKNDTWEALFIRDKENFHNLKMKVGYGTTQEFEIGIAHGAEISIKVTDPKSSTAAYQPTPTFNRDVATDMINDMRWVLNFSGKELHEKRVNVEKRARDNFFFTPNALFYTLSLSGKHYMLQKTDHGSPVGNPESLQDIGEFSAGDIECGENGTITVEIKEANGMVNSYPLKKGAEVFFDNRCLVNVPECANDFHHYYDVIKTGSEKFELKYSPTLIEDWTKSATMPKGLDFACEGGTVCCIENPKDSLNY
jgi:hypothetical protein